MIKNIFTKIRNLFYWNIDNKIVYLQTRIPRNTDGGGLYNI